ncbi:MAG TPA: PQQ-dependent sugar dehydrogenase, partial [Pyrinomonadaceae bacterium]|nr:PQQ-dependent sugar dehydrogenase [Pyrinomonadaceae bacterium]
MKRNQFAFVLTIFLMAVSAACAQNSREAAKTSASTAASPASTSGCAPLESRTAHASEQKPAFAGQTRACAVKSNVAFDVTVVAKGLKNPWAVEPHPNGDFLITEKTGNLRVVSAKGEIGQPIGGLQTVGSGGVSAASGQGGLPPITARQQGGLLDVALSPNFAKDRTIFWSFSEQREDGSGTSVARGRLTEDQRNLEQVSIIFRAMPTYKNGLHFGSRLAFGRDNMLYITLGDRFDRPNREKVQQLDNHLGKIIRISPDGSVPADNPFAKQSGTMPEIWILGHRNLQSAAFDEKGRLWTVEHGAKGGDELNLIEKGKNYGWSIVTFGEEYSGQPIPEAVTTREGFVDP